MKQELLSILSFTLHRGVRGGLLLLALITSVSTTFAHDAKIYGIYYNFDNSTKTASVTYRGDYASSYDDEYSGSVIIPETVTYFGITYSVTSIGNDAFEGCSGLTSVTIGDSVTSIGDRTFYECSSLASVTIGESVTSIGEYAFYGCSGLISVTIGNSVTSIGEYAFRDCSGLESVTIGNSVTSIGGHAFDYCDGLTKTNYTGDIASWCNIKFGNYTANPMYYTHNFFIDDQEIKDLVIPNSVTSIGNDAFHGCSGLTSVTIGNGVTSIGESAFYGCEGLTSVTIGNSVTSIGDRTFYECSSLASVTIGESVTSIGYGAFYDCDGLESVTIGNSVTNIGECAFYDCEGLTSVTIGNSVTSIGDRTFYECSSLASVTIGESVTSIGEYAFYGCSGLISVTIPNSVTSIGDYAFDGCYGLISVTIGNSVTSIGEYAFRDCDGLESVTIGNNVTSIGESAFAYCSKLTKTNYIGDIASWCDIKFGNYAANPMSYSNNFYINDQEIKDVVIPNSVDSIHAYAFRDCSGLTSVTIGNGVTSIGESAFYYCEGLTSVTIGNSVTSIGKRAFGMCYGITSVIWNANNYPNLSSESDAPFYGIRNSKKITNFVFGDSVEHIPAYLCYEMSNLSSVTIGNSVTSIGKLAFDGCSGLTSVIWNAKNYPNISSASESPFYDSHSKITNFVFGDSVEHIPAYLCYSMDMMTSITIPNSVTSIGNNAFFDCDGLTSVTIPNSVTSIGNNAFEGCGIRTVTIGNNVDSIGEKTFYMCSMLDSVTIGNSVKSIGDQAFYDCNLKSVTIPNSVTSIGNHAFALCRYLTSVTIGNSVESIGNYAFSNWIGFQTVICKATEVPKLGTNVFNSSVPISTATLYVPAQSLNDYKAADQWKDFGTILPIEDSSEDPVEPNPEDPKPEEPTDSDMCLESADERAVFFQGSDFGTSANVYMWDPANGNIELVGAWPGTAATHLGDGKFKFVVPASAAGNPSTWMIIWNSNGKQTADLTFKMHGVYNFNGCNGTVTALCDGGVPSDVNNIKMPTEETSIKFLRDGQLLILRDGKTYNIMGQEL